MGKKNRDGEKMFNAMMQMTRNIFGEERARAMYGDGYADDKKEP